MVRRQVPGNGRTCSWLLFSMLEADGASGRKATAAVSPIHGIENGGVLRSASRSCIEAYLTNVQV
jgi:hypothetical protein